MPLVWSFCIRVDVSILLQRTDFLYLFVISHIIHEGRRCLLCTSDWPQYERNTQTVKSAYDTKIVCDCVVNNVKTVFLMRLLCNRHGDILPEVLIKKEVKCTVLVICLPLIIDVD